MSNEKVLYLDSENFEKEVLESDMPVVLDFYADWCGPCQMVGPIISELADEFDGKVKLCKINIDQQRKLAVSHKVMSIPTILFMKNGEVVDRVTGAIPKQDFVSKIEKML